MHQAFKQALHIFKKDLRYLRNEVALVALIAAVFAAMHAPVFHASNNSWLAELALVAVAAFLIGRLVLAEAIPGDRQFWITRPYRWQSLLTAKILFIAAFVNLSILLAHLCILAIDGFPLIPSVPGLLWEQVLLFTFIALPFAALAVLNAGMAAFIFSQLMVFAAVAGLWQVLPRGTAQLGGVEWVRDSIATIALVAIAGPVLFIQYQARRTLFSRWFAICGIVIGSVLFVALPWPLALAMQSHWSKEPSIGSSIKLAVGRQQGERAWLARMKPKVALHLPVSVWDIPDGMEVQPDALSISLEGADRSTTAAAVVDCSELKRETNSASAVTISTVCLIDPAFFHKQKGQPVTLHGSLYFTVFGNARSQTLPLSDEPANALDGLQCYTDVVKAEWDVYCRSAFRWPARLVYAKLGDANANSFTQIVSYSPFPASLSMEPVETRWASAFASGPPATVRDVTIVVKEPLAHLRREFDARGVQLDGLAYPSVFYGTIPAIQ
jgi:hypothetical protein